MEISYTEHLKHCMVIMVGTWNNISYTGNTVIRGLLLFESHEYIIQGLSRKYPSIFNISRTGRVALV